MVEEKIHKVKLNQIQEEMKQELFRLFDFWETEVVNENPKGFIGQIDHFGNKNYKAKKGIILCTRILWTFSAGYHIFKEKKFKAVADKMYQYLINYFWDKEQRGVFWTVDHKNKPVNKRKQAYAQAYGIYSLSEFYRTTGNIESLEYAKQLYHIIESSFKDNNNDGYIEALNKHWTQLKNMYLSTKKMNVQKKMNIHLHILKSYPNFV